MSGKLKSWRLIAILNLVVAIVLSSCSSPAAPKTTPQVVTKEVTRIVEVPKEVTRVVEQPVTPVAQPTTPDCSKLDCTPRILIESAFDAELYAFVDAAVIKKVVVVNGRSVYLGTLNGNQVAMTLSGTSMINAAMSTQALLDHLTVERVVYSGISGGVSPERNIGDVVVPARWCEYQENLFAREAAPDKFSPPPWFSTKAPANNFGMMYPEGVYVARKSGEVDQEEEMVWYPVDEEMLSVARRAVKNVQLEDCAASGECLDPAPVVTVGGSGVSGPTFVDNADYRKYVWETWGAESLEMETAAVAHVCYVNEVPFLGFRSLSDLAGGGPGENEIGTFFQVAARNSAKVMLAFLEGWANRASLPPEPTIKAGFIYVGPIGDYGWSHAHNEGRLYVEKKFPWLKTIYVESVPEPDVERVIDRLIVEERCDVVFTTSFGFMDGTLAAALKYPDKLFFHCSGYKRAPNLGTYFIDFAQLYYLNGLMAGALSKTGKAGYVGAFPIAEVVRHINSFVLGFREINPKGTVDVNWLMSWYDPVKAKQAAEALIAGGVDALAFTEDSPSVLQVAEEYTLGGQPVYAFSHYSPMEKFGPNATVSGQLVDWGILYEDILAKIRDRIYLPTNLESVDYWWLMAEDAAKLGGSFDHSINPKFIQALQMVKHDDVATKTANVLDLVNARVAQMSSSPPTFDPFTGPILDQNGKEQIPAGRVATFEELLTMQYLVQGCTGQLP